jgi:hypothetical protein
MSGRKFERPRWRPRYPLEKAPSELAHYADNNQFIFFLRTFFPGRIIKVLPITAIMLLMSFGITQLTNVVFSRDALELTTAANNIILVTSVFIAFAVSNALQQGAATASLLAGTWSDLMNTLATIGIHISISGASIPARQTALKVVSMIQQQCSTITHGPRHNCLHIIKNSNGATLIEVLSQLGRVMKNVLALSEDTVMENIGDVIRLTSTILTIRGTYLLHEYNKATVSFITVTYVFFFPLTVYPVFGWYYLLLEAYILLLLLSAYDTATECGDAFVTASCSAAAEVDDVETSTTEMMQSLLNSLDRVAGTDSIKPVK